MEEVDRCLASLWLKLAVSNVFFLGCKSLVERLCWLRAQGHHSRAMFTSRCPKSTIGGDASELM